MRKVLSIVLFCLLISGNAISEPQVKFDNSIAKVISQTYRNEENGRIQVTGKQWGIESYDFKAKERFELVCQELKKRGFIKTDETIDWEKMRHEYRLCGFSLEYYEGSGKRHPRTRIDIPGKGAWGTLNDDLNYPKKLMDIFDKHFSD